MTAALRHPLVSLCPKARTFSITHGELLSYGHHLFDSVFVYMASLLKDYGDGSPI